MKLQEREALFAHPTAAYRGKPFWSWNGKLSEDELKRQLDVMKQMGFGGYFMHSRTGLSTEYLGEEWFRLINASADYGSSLGMESWLYDEDRWPSGTAGGRVTENESYRASFLEEAEFTPQQWDALEDKDGWIAFLAEMKDGALARYVKLDLQETTGAGMAAGAAGSAEDVLSGQVVLAYHVAAAPLSDNYNGTCYLDTMNPEAVQAFIASTHARYAEECGGRLGGEIPGIFTDEPHRGPMFTGFSESSENRIPYTPALFDEFQTRFGYALQDRLPEVFCRLADDRLSTVTRDYIECCQELFLENFAMPIHDWCKEHNMLFTGHVLHEDSLSAQTIMQGSLMRFYEYMDYPGIDCLAEHNTCFWIAKQVASVAGQLGKKWVLSELYGATGWQMDFEDYKNVGDWQALLGVNLRCPHLSWYTMKGEAKRDYPASILHQSAWYEDYAYLEDYFSRIHAALQESEPVCDLLVLYPIESVWARAYNGAFETLDARDPKIAALERRFTDTFHLLMENRIDFDYGEEAILAEHAAVRGDALQVGERSYHTILVTGMETMRSSTLQLLTQFAAAGGRIIFAGDPPCAVDALPSPAPAELAGENVYRTEFSGEALLPLLADLVNIRVERVHGEQMTDVHEDDAQALNSQGNDATVRNMHENASAALNALYCRRFRVEGGEIIFLLNTDRDHALTGLRADLGHDVPGGLWQWDPRTGERRRLPYEVLDGRIRIDLTLERGGERLYFLAEEPVTLPDTFAYTLSEPNIAVLDVADVASDTGFSVKSLEVLKADRALRDHLQIPWRGGEMLQPWYREKYKAKEDGKSCRVTLRYSVEISELPAGVCLAVEDLPDMTKICVNDTVVPPVSIGKWVDVCFDKLAVPDEAWKTGKNIIEIEMAYNAGSGLEAIYLLGDFGVEIDGASVTLTKLPQVLTVGDVTAQGLAFYSGRIVYELPDEMKEMLEGKACRVTFKTFGGAAANLLGAPQQEEPEGAVGGRTKQTVAFAPFTGTITGLTAIEIVLFRRNTFGPLHEADKYPWAISPVSFTTEGEDWTDDYQLYPAGLLEKPELTVM